MKIDLSKPVKWLYPEKGEENLIYEVVNYNKKNSNIMMKVLKLPNWNQSLLPIETAHISEIINI